MKKYTIEKIIEHIFTSENPETGSKPSKDLAWAIFENGTVFIVQPYELIPIDISFEEFANIAIEEIQEFGVPVAGTPNADFSVNPLSWYPDDFVYIVGYDNPVFFNIGIYEKETDHLYLGTLARTERGMDTEAPRVRHIRLFDGSKKDYEL